MQTDDSVISFVSAGFQLHLQLIWTLISQALLFISIFYRHEKKCLGIISHLSEVKYNF